MKDITSTSFGLVIAFLLPGLSGLFGLKYFSPYVEKLFSSLLSSDPSFGLVLMILFAGLAIGLLATSIRWIIYEKWLCGSLKLSEDDYRSIGSNQHKFLVFRAATDEFYRYHQFWGNMTIVMPIFFIGWLSDGFQLYSCAKFLFSGIGFIVLEVITGLAAVASYKNLIRITKLLMEGD